MTMVLVVLMLTLSLGAHWALLQSVAWVGMIASYSRNATLGEALVKTFDGEHPCKLCKVVEKGRQSEKKQELLKINAKKDYICESKVSVLFPPSTFQVLSSPDDSSPGRIVTPPVPPPRGLFV